MSITASHLTLNKKNRGFVLYPVLFIGMAVSVIVGLMVAEQGEHALLSKRSITSSIIESEAARFSEALKLASYRQWLNIMATNGSWSTTHSSSVLDDVATLMTGWTITDSSPSSISLSINRSTYSSSSNAIVPNLFAFVSTNFPIGLSATLPSRMTASPLSSDTGLLSDMIGFADMIDGIITLSGNGISRAYKFRLHLIQVPAASMALSSTGNLQVTSDWTSVSSKSYIAKSLTGGSNLSLQSGIIAGNLSSTSASSSGNSIASTLSGENGYAYQGLVAAGKSSVTDASKIKTASLSRIVQPQHFLLPGASILGLSAETLAIYRKILPFYQTPIQNRVVLTLNGIIDPNNPSACITSITGSGNEASASSLPSWITIQTRKNATNADVLILSVNIAAVPAISGSGNAYVSVYDLNSSSYTSNRIFVSLSTAKTLSFTTSFIATPNNLFFGGSVNTDSSIPFEVYANSVSYGWNHSNVSFAGTFSGIEDADTSFKTAQGSSVTIDDLTIQTRNSAGNGDFYTATIKVTPQ